MTKNINRRIAIFLAPWVVALPAMPAFGQQQRSTQPPPPMFHGEGQEYVITKDSGLEVRSALGHWHHGDASTRGGDVAAESPWGERLEARYVASDEGLEVVINERISIFTSMNALGNPTELVVQANGKQSVVNLAAQAQRIAAGGLLIEPPEEEAYAMLIEALAQEHSPEFWRALADEYTTALPVGCGFQVAGCALNIIGWLGSLSGVVAICGGAVATAGALTLGCLGAILVHPTVSVSTALACGSALSCLQDQWDNSQGDGGCSSPGGQE